MTLWLRISMDKYELPMVVADTSTELARMCGVAEGTVASSIHHSKVSGHRSRYVKVDIEEDDE